MTSTRAADRASRRPPHRPRTDRPQLLEARTSPGPRTTPSRWRRSGPDGKGEGKLVPAAKIDYDQESKTLEIENYNTEPVRLTEVQVVK